MNIKNNFGPINTNNGSTKSKNYTDSLGEIVLFSDSYGKVDSYIDEFRTNNYIKLPNLLTADFFNSLREECLNLLEVFSRRKDFVMVETDSTLRKISTVSGNVINEESQIIADFYKSTELTKFLGKLSGTELYFTPDLADRHTIHKLHKKGDEHGGHLDTYPYVLIFILEHPSENEGGELVFVPNSSNLNDLSTDYVIKDSFKVGECYFMKASINIHCVLPLKKDVNRTVLVFTYADSISKDIIESYSSSKLYD